MKFAYVKQTDADLYLVDVHQPTLSKVPQLYLNKEVAAEAYMNFRRLMRAAGKEPIDMKVREVNL